MSANSYFAFFVLLRTAFPTDNHTPPQRLDTIPFIKEFLNQFPGLQLVQPRFQVFSPEEGSLSKAVCLCRTAHPPEMSRTPQQ